MKKLSVLFFTLLLLMLAACEKDQTVNPGGSNNTSTKFVGSWNRDSVLVNLVNSSNVKTRVETYSNYGVYNFKSDETGVLTVPGGTEYAVTWFYDKDQDKITISEQDWLNQSYNITDLGNNKYILTGIQFIGGNNKQERILYLSKM